jgi:hypothetical protein
MPPISHTAIAITPMHRSYVTLCWRGQSTANSSLK